MRQIFSLKQKGGGDTIDGKIIQVHILLNLRKEKRCQKTQLNLHFNGKCSDCLL